ncbi:MAG: hypothetical protein HY593_01420, partial [Candidatus Omnitrophica bacterium]|nr:hypothetical protein [Candidatus Omnitrophota bacterium]
KGEASGSFIEKSIEAYQAALARAPTWAEGWFYLGKSKMLAGRPKEGLEDMERGVRLSPYNRDLYLYLIVHCLREADRTLLSERKREYRERARFWMGRASVLKRPFTREDYDFIGLGVEKLNQKDREKIKRLIDEDEEIKFKSPLPPFK